MLFVHDNEGEIFERHVLLEESMRADYDTRESGRERVFECFFGDGFRTECLIRTREERDLNGLARE